MSYWHWGPELELGIDVIDAQHRRIVDYINELHEAMNRKDGEAVGRVVDELVNYTITHFAFEESLMERGGYPLLDAHKHVHETFTNQIHRYRDEHRRGAEVGNELMSTLRVWLTNHIKRDDRDYTPKVKASLEEHHKSGWIGSALKKFFG